MSSGSRRHGCRVVLACGDVHMTRISFGGNAYALSASPLSHAERPLGLAFLLYPAFSCGVQRNSTRAVEGFFRGGLPLPRFGTVMWLLYGHKKALTSPHPSYIMSVH